jgi:hypothetical protein
MSREYQIVNSEGKPKATWESILCDSIDVNSEGLVMFYIDNQYGPAIVYKLGNGEALVYLGEE